MAMSRICALGAAFLAQASATGFEWDRYMQEYAGAYHKGPMDGKFSEYTRRYAGNFSADEEAYADQYSQDRIAEARRYEDDYASSYEGDYAGAHEPALGRAALLVETPAALGASLPVQNASAPPPNYTRLAAEALAAERQAAERAEAAVKDLRTWDAGLKRDLDSKPFAATVARGILTKAEAAYAARREELERRFNATLRALDPAALATANASDVRAAEHAAKAAMEDFRKVDREEAKAMRATLNSIERAGKVKARMLERRAHEAARQALRSASAAERAQRKAGVEERQYERDEARAERDSERLMGQAEEVAERAEGHIERQFGKVEHHLERMMDERDDGEVAAARKARKEHLHRARHLVEEARKAVREKAAEERAEKEVRDTPLKDAPAEAAPQETPHEEVRPGVFLARGPERGSGAALIVPLACFAAVGAALSLLALLLRRGSAVVERPLLG